MKQTLSVILFLITMVCKSQTTERKWIKLEEYAEEQYKKDILKKDPLILLDGELIGLLSEINLQDSRFNPVQTTSLSIIPKGSTYFKNVLGENAENGVINISRRITFYCGTNRPKTILLINDAESSVEVLKSLKEKEILDWREINYIKDIKGEVISFIIITTKKRKK